MSELDLNTNHRILPAELCGPAPWLTAIGNAV